MVISDKDEISLLNLFRRMTKEQRATFLKFGSGLLSGRGAV